MHSVVGLGIPAIVFLFLIGLVATLFKLIFRLLTSTSIYFLFPSILTSIPERACG